MSSLRVALLSAWHVHAIDYLREARDLERIDVVTFWDSDVARGIAFADDHAVPFEPDLDAVLANPEIDAVICTSATRDHRELLVRAAEAGKHIFTEKVLAAAREDAEAIVKAVESADVRLMGSLPRLTGSAYLTAQQVLDEGRLGQVSFARCRVAHDGAVSRSDVAGGDRWLPDRFFDRDEAQGGALIDLGAHPIYLLGRLLGRPIAVHAQLTAVTDAARSAGVDDNAVLVAEHAGGALSVAETGFASAPNGLQLELHGSDGILESSDDAAWFTPRGGRRTAVAMVPPGPSPMAQWRDHISGGPPPTLGPGDLLMLTDVNEAAARSSAEGVRITLA